MRRPKSIASVRKRLLGRNRTDLYDWFWSHWDELPEYQPYRVDWPGMVTDLTALGLKGRDENKPLSIGAVRKTFFRVMRDKDDEAKLPRRQPASPPPAPVQSPPVHQPVPVRKTTEGIADASRHTASTGFEHDPHANEDAIRRRFLGEED